MIEKRFKNGDGPFALIIVPSSEMALQISDVIQWICDSLPNSDFPEVRVGLAMSISQQININNHQQINIKFLQKVKLPPQKRLEQYDHKTKFVNYNVNLAANQLQES
ncbi:hypothetical protein ACQ4LE_001847 [Meloidogyne hapla]